VTSAAAIWMLAALGALIGMDMLHQALLLTVVTSPSWWGGLSGSQLQEPAPRGAQSAGALAPRAEPSVSSHQDDLGSGIEK
jgi:putative Mg2+ transporter-C (MgtC) family protein